MKAKIYSSAGLLCLSMLIGCVSSSQHASPASPKTQTIRNNSYSLLYQLLGEEKDVNKLHFIKHEEPDLQAFIKSIAVASKAGLDQLSTFAKQDPTLRLDDVWLPDGEVKTRDSISAAEQKQLLHSSGDNLALILLLTQIEALNYASHLAKVSAQNDFQPDRVNYLNGLSAEMLNLHDQAVARLTLRTPTINSGK